MTWILILTTFAVAYPIAYLHGRRSEARARDHGFQLSAQELAKFDSALERRRQREIDRW